MLWRPAYLAVFKIIVPLELDTPFISSKLNTILDVLLLFPPIKTCK